MFPEEETTEMLSIQHLQETIKQLQAEVENLKLELKRAKNQPLRKTSFILVSLGAAALISSILINSHILAFIGLALTFWGALIFFVKSARYVQSDLLTLTAMSIYKTVDRILKDLKFKGKSYYILTYPNKVYSQKCSEGLGELIVFIAGNSRKIPSKEELIESKFLNNPYGICITPPGLGLLSQFEKELKKDFSQIKLTELSEVLPPLIVDNLHLAKKFDMHVRDNHVYLKIFNSTFRDLYTIEEKLKSIHSLGCPLISAIACAIAKASGKAVIIVGGKLSDDKQAIEVWYRIVQDIKERMPTSEDALKDLA